MMKLNYILAAVLFILPFIGWSQTNTCLQKVYGFSRVVVGGAPPTDVVEVGDKVVGTTGGSSNTEYIIYLQTCYVSSVTITGLWINGTAYSAKAIKAKTPVVTDNGSPAKKMSETLIKKTTSTVWNLAITPDETMFRQTPSLQKLITTNAVVITGILKGKRFSTSLKHLKALRTFTAQ